MPKAIDIIPIANMFSSLSGISLTLFLGSLSMIIKLANLSRKIGDGCMLLYSLAFSGFEVVCEQQNSLYYEVQSYNPLQ